MANGMEIALVLAVARAGTPPPIEQRLVFVNEEIGCLSCGGIVGSTGEAQVNHHSLDLGFVRSGGVSEGGRDLAGQIPPCSADAHTSERAVKNLKFCQRRSGVCGFRKQDARLQLANQSLHGGLVQIARAHARKVFAENFADFVKFRKVAGIDAKPAWLSRVLK